MSAPNLVVVLGDKIFTMEYGPHALRWSNKNIKLSPEEAKDKVERAQRYQGGDKTVQFSLLEVFDLAVNNFLMLTHRQHAPLTVDEIRDLLDNAFDGKGMQDFIKQVFEAVTYLGPKNDPAEADQTGTTTAGEANSSVT